MRVGLFPLGTEVSQGYRTQLPETDRAWDVQCSSTLGSLAMASFNPIGAVDQEGAILYYDNMPDRYKDRYKPQPSITIGSHTAPPFHSYGQKSKTVSVENE